jgi:hypothetical protein
MPEPASRNIESAEALEREVDQPDHRYRAGLGLARQALNLPKRQSGSF